jgi:hypothetical protein
MIDALAPDRSDQPFSKTILPRRGRCGRLVPDAHGAQSACDDHCACRKSNTHIQMMESAKKWRGHNATNGMYCSRHRRVLVD